MCIGFFRLFSVSSLQRVLEGSENISLLSAKLMFCLNLTIGSVYFSLIRTPFVDRKEQVLSAIRLIASWAK